LLRRCRLRPVRRKELSGSDCTGAGGDPSARRPYRRLSGADGRGRHDRPDRTRPERASRIASDPAQYFALLDLDAVALEARRRSRALSRRLSPRRTGMSRPRQALDYCCFSQNDSNPCEAEPPITQGMPTATCPSAAAETQPSATAPTPTCPQKLRSRRLSEPLILSSSTAASASLRRAAICTVPAASTTSASGTLPAAGC